MREKTRQALLADAGTADESLPATTGTAPQRRKYAQMDLSSAAGVRAAMAHTEGMTDEEMARIRAAAKKFGVAMSAMTAEDVLAPILMLEATGEAVQILAEAADNGGVMKVKVPWYVGNSVARIAGFSKRLYFPSSILAETVERGNARIAAKTPGMTSYARHAHAVAGTEVPCGDVIALEQNGNKGYATIAINATRWGQDIQALARAGQLRAVSMRTDILDGRGGYRAVERKVNGELMLETTQLDVAGIDFAPDGAALPMQEGVEVLAAEAAVEPAPTIPSRRNHSMDEITVDGLRAESPQVVKEIEAPLQARITELEVKVEAQITAEKARERDALVAEIAAKFPDPAVALPELQRLCAEATSKDEVAALAMPLLLENLTKTAAEAPKVETPEDKLRAMFQGGGVHGQAITAEVATLDDSNSVDGFAVPSN